MTLICLAVMNLNHQQKVNQLDIVQERMVEEALRKKIFKEYKITLDRIRKMLALFYEKYAVNGELNLPEVNKYGRLDKLEDAIKKELRSLGNKQIAITRRLIQDIYRESYQRQAYAIESTVNERDY